MDTATAANESAAIHSAAHNAVECMKRVEELIEEGASVNAEIVSFFLFEQTQ